MTKCPYCGEEFKNYNGLSKHIFKYKAHECDVIMKIKNKITSL